MTKEKGSFEENLNALEHIVNQLEKGDLSLDEALVQFEQGVKLAKESQKQLKNAEQKIKVLLSNDELSDFEGEASITTQSKSINFDDDVPY